MRIDGTGRPIQSAGRPSGGAGRSGEAFRPESGGSTARSAPTTSAAVSVPSGIDALLALQSVDDATTGRRRTIRRAGLLIDALEDIQADLLVGRTSEGRLNRAIALLTQAKSSTEPGLDALVADIELRVRVELAKLGKYPPM